MGDVNVIGMMVSLDRGEKGKGEISALNEVASTYGFPTGAIVTMKEVIEYLYNREVMGKVVIDDEIKARIDEYYAQYGAK